MDDRLTRLRNLLRTNKLDAALVSSPTNIVYFSDFSGFSSIERDGYIVITKKNGYILTGSLYAEAVRTDVSHLTLLDYGRQPFAELFKTLVTKHQLKRVGFEAENLTVSEWSQFRMIIPKLIPLNLKQLRSLKSREEIEQIKRAAQIADKALAEIISSIRPGITEVELVNLLENRIRAALVDIAFPTIVAFGKNAAIPHHKSGSTKLLQNDLILIDFGATSHEYRSDMTRTFFIGKATAEQKKAYKAVLASQQKAAEYIQEQLSSKFEPTSTFSIPPKRESRQTPSRSRIKSGMTIKAAEVDFVARDSLISQGYPPLPHSLGHGIGLAVHEAPALSPYSKDVIEEGMVFSIEPGVYFPGKFGIRIEDLYTIQQGKLIRLTHTPSELQEI